MVCACSANAPRCSSHHEQVEKLKRIAARQGSSVGAVIRDAIDGYVDPGADSRQRAVDSMLTMNAPVDDWDVMKAEILRSQLGDW